MKYASAFKITKDLSLPKIEKVKITSSRDAERFARQFYYEDIEIYESFFLIFADRANNTTGYAKISQGGVAGTVVDLKIVAKLAVDYLACGVILCHNHPSGNLNPSSADLEITRKAKEGLRLLDITVLDHLILTAESYYSFADQGRL
jgi:DNA repair protein RadC